PLIIISPLGYLYHHHWTQLSKSNLAGYAVKCSLNLIIPCVLVSVLLTIVTQLIFYLWSLADIPIVFGSNGFLNYPREAGLLYVTLNSILWFVGIHGGNTLQLLMTQLNEAAQLSTAFMPNTAFLSSFVFIGGSGSTFSLILAALLFCQNKTIRLLALASIPIGLFNVNELLLFGLPIMLNPRLFIPFLCTPLVTFTISYLAVDFQIIHVVTDKFDLTIPVGLNAYLASGTNPLAVVLQFSNVIIGTFIYYPFIKYIDINSGAKKIIIKSLNTTYSQFHEEAVLYIYNPIQQVHLLRYQQIEQEKQIDKLTKMEFYLEYQPNVSPFTGKFLSCEALIRAKDNTGKSVYPDEFLPLLKDANLMRSLDLWVAQAAIAQYKTWRDMEMDIPFTINVTADTLSNEKAFSELISCIANANGKISIEITEQSFVDSFERINEVAKLIHAIGAKVYIDDFGTGYSSLAHLYKYDLDYLKIDRSFVLALDTEKGRNIMQVVFKLAESLGVEIVVEGVESVEQLEKMPLDYRYGVQGWLYSKALPAYKIPDFLIKHHPIYNLEKINRVRVI
ncbi:MAG: EAL domain-containing protein, partial [Methylococcales bacterium]